MNYIERFEQELPELEPLWGAWYVDEKIGEGSYSTVYRLKRRELGGREYLSALKVICLPASEAERSHLLSMTRGEEQAKAFVCEMVEEVSREIGLMYELKGHTNIVSFEDHQIIEREGGARYYLLIRMELLQSFVSVLRNRDLHPLTRQDVLRLGCDICAALETCAAHHIVHRDVKPDNLFVNKDGSYKLGDFGISRKLEQTMMASYKGTVAYMAPEVHRGGAYSGVADLYSLGVVLYQMLNGGRLPLLPEDHKFTDMEKAIEARLGGAELPRPAEAQDELGQVILKACAHSPGDRFSSPGELRRALEAFREDVSAAPEKVRRQPLRKWLRRTLLSAGIAALCAGVFWLAGGFTLLFGGHGSAPLPEIFAALPRVQYGSTQANLGAGGFFAFKDGYLYTSDYEGAGYRVKLDGSDRRTVSGYPMNNINVLGRFLYYTNYQPYHHGIYRKEVGRTGPESLTKLWDISWCETLVVTDSALYCAVKDTAYTSDPDASVRCDLYKMDTDGGNRVRLVADISRDGRIWTDGSWVFYKDGLTGYLHKISADGRRRECVVGEAVGDFAFWGDWLYFSCGYLIYRVPAGSLNARAGAPVTAAFDGVEREGDAKLAFDGGILYVPYGRSIVRIKGDGNWDTLLDDTGAVTLYGDVSGLYFVDEWIYFSDTKNVLRVKTDGTEPQTLNADEVTRGAVSYDEIY